MKRLLVLVAFIVGAPTALHAAEATIIVLHQESLAADELRLIEALRIYTRDLESRVFARGDAPATVDTEALDRIATEARADDADIVLWAQRRSDGAAVFNMFNVPARDVRQIEMDAIGSERAAVEVALKVRAFLSDRKRRRSQAPSSDPSRKATSAANHGTPVGPTDATTLKKAARIDTASVSDTDGATGPVAIAEAQPSPPAPSSRIASRFAFGTGFHVVSPTDTTWLRIGVLVGAAVRLGGQSSRYWLYLDGAFTSRPRAHVGDFQVTLKDLPVGAGVQALWSFRRVGVALGSRTTLHIFDVNASAPDGRTGAAERYALGLGGLARAEFNLLSHVRMALTLSAERLVPTQEFTVAGQQALRTGSVLFAATAGIMVSIP